MKSCATVYSSLLLQLTSTLTNEEERRKPRDKIKPEKKKKVCKNPRRALQILLSIQIKYHTNI